MKISNLIHVFFLFLLMICLLSCQSEQSSIQTSTIADLTIVELGRIDITQASINYDQHSLGLVINCASIGTIDMIEVQYIMQNMNPAQVMGGGPTECKPQMNLITISPQFRWPRNELPFKLLIKVDRPMGITANTFNCHYETKDQILKCLPE